MLVAARRCHRLQHPSVEVCWQQRTFRLSEIDVRFTPSEDAVTGQVVGKLRFGEAMGADTETTLIRLRNAFDKGNLEFVVGAGASMAAGLPDWNTLNQRFFRKFFNKETEQSGARKSFLPVALDEEEVEAVEKEFREYFGRDAVIDLLRDQLEGPIFRQLLHEALYADIGGYDLQPLHYELACCVLNQPNREHQRWVYTLNYDDILESAMEEIEGQRPRSLTEGTPKELSVVHLHGLLPLDGLPESEKEEQIILSEKDYLATEGSWADERLEGLFDNKETDVVLLGMSLRDPRLRRLLHRRAQSAGGAGGTVYAILSESDIEEEVGALATRRARRMVANQIAPYWEAWDIEVIWVTNHEFIPSLLRRIRFGDDVKTWLEKGAEFLEKHGAEREDDKDSEDGHQTSSHVYNRLFDPGRQAEMQIFARRRYALMRHQFEVPQGEYCNMSIFVPDPETKGQIVPVFQYVEDFRKHRTGARRTKVSIPDEKMVEHGLSELGFERDDSGDIIVRTLEEEHARARTLDVSSWENPEGASGHAMLTGTIVQAGSPAWWYRHFDTDKIEKWDEERTFSSLLAVPVYDSKQWVPIGVISLTSIRKNPFWEHLDTDAKLNLYSFLRASFRNLLEYSSVF